MSIRKRFSSLLTGPAIALLIGFFAGPIISRLYSPEVFGQYSVLVAIVGLASVVVTLRFENLIPTCKNPVANYWISISLSLVGSIFIGGVSLVFLTPEETLFIVSSMILLVLFNSSYYLLISSNQYYKASSGRAIQATGIFLGQGWLGLNGSNLLGLMWGEIIGRIFSVFVVIKLVRVPSRSEITCSFLEQWRVILWLFPSAIIGSLALQALPLGMLWSVGPASAGIFILVYRMVVIPNALISKVANDSLLVEFGKFNKNNISYRNTVSTSMHKLLFMAIGLYGFIGVQGVWIFPIILGEGWEVSGKIIPWLSLLVGFWSLASPMAAVFIFLGKANYSFWFSSLDLTNRIFALTLGMYYQDIMIATAALSIGGSMVYGLSTACSLLLSGTNIKVVVSEIFWPLILMIILLILSTALLLMGYMWLSFIISSLNLMFALWKVVHD